MVVVTKIIVQKEKLETTRGIEVKIDVISLRKNKKWERKSSCKYRKTKTHWIKNKKYWIE